MEPDDNLTHHKQSEKQPQLTTPPSTSSSANFNQSSMNTESGDGQQHSSIHNREKLITGPNSESEPSAPTISFGNMDSNPSREGLESCQACQTPEFLDKYCGVKLCTKCVGFVAKMVKKKFAVKCKQDGKCKTTPNLNGKIRCKSCKLKSMIKLNIMHPVWIDYKNSLSASKSRPTDSSCSTSSATPHPTPSAPNQPILNDPQPTRSSSSDHKAPQPGCSTSNTSPKVKEATKSEAHKIGKLECGQGGSRATCCRACQRPKDDHDSTLCQGCIEFVVDVRYAGKGFKCNQQGDTSKKEHLMICSACRLNRITDVTDQMPLAQVDHRRPQPIEKQASTSRQTSSHHGQPPRPQAQSVSTNVTTNNSSSNSRSQNELVCRGCCNPNRVAMHFGLFLCENCCTFIRNNSRMPARFHKRCVRGGSCNTRYRPGRKMCASCRTRRLRKLDIQEPRWIKYRQRLGLIRKSDTPVMSATKEPSTSTSKNSSRTDQNQIKSKRPHKLISKKCRACSNPNVQANLFGGTLICSACRSFILYTIETVSEPLICKREGRCNTRYKPGSVPCRACRIRKLIFSYRIKKGPWTKFKKMYIAKLNETNLYNTTKVERTEQQPSVARQQPQAASNLNNDRPDDSVPPASELISEENCEQNYSWCNDCESQFVSAHPNSRLNYSTEQDSGVCQSPTLQDDPAPGPVDPVCPTCLAKRAASLGLRVRHSSSPVKLTSPSKPTSPSKAGGHEHASNCVSRSPTKNDQGRRKQSLPCPICRHTEHVGWASVFGITCCQNCRHFLKQASKKPEFPPDCITGKYNCELKHISLSEWNRYNRMCSGCRARKAISIGFKIPPPSSEPMAEPQQQQQDRSDGNNQMQQEVSESPGHRELATSVSVISGNACVSALLCDFCHGPKQTGCKAQDGYQSCHSCDIHLQNCETKLFALLKCKTVAANCENRALKLRPKKVCYRCLAKRAISLGYKWTKQSEIVAMLTDPAEGTAKRSSTDYGQCDICPFKRMRIDSGFGFRCCVKCRKFLVKASKSKKNIYTCARNQFKCLNKYAKDKYWPCSGCRLKRAIDLGYKDSTTKDWLEDNDLSTEPVDAVRSTPSPSIVVDAISEALTTTAEQESQIADVPSPIGCLFVEDDDEDCTQLAADRRPSPAANYDDTIELENLQDYQTRLHPSETLDRVLCRWFSCEKDLPGPSPEPIAKTPEDEIFPTPEVRVIVFSNDIGAGHTMPLVTQDLSPSERPAVEELTVTKLHMKASSSLRQTLLLDKTNASIATQPPRTKAAKPKMTLTLKTLRATVDRRHLLKKQKTSAGANLRTHTSEQPTTRMTPSPPLIAPGEDCDASDDENDEFPAIDCNY